MKLVSISQSGWVEKGGGDIPQERYFQKIVLLHPGGRNYNQSGFRTLMPLFFPLILSLM